MDKHPSQYLNEMVAYYSLRYLRAMNYEFTGSEKNLATWDFLVDSGIDPRTDPRHFNDSIAHKAAVIQRYLVLSKEKNTSLRSVRHEYPELLPVISHGPQAWLILTYLSLLENLYMLDKGHMEYGMGKTYRNIVENVQAARMMFEAAAIRNADMIYSLFGHLRHLTYFEAGAGNGDATLKTVKRFAAEGKSIDFLLSDIDPATQPVAEWHFRNQGINYTPWTKVDLLKAEDLHRVARIMEDTSPVVNVNFIIHELEGIAENFFASMSAALPGARLAITEFFLPDYKDPAIPYWFIYLHRLSRQHLRSEADLMKIAGTFGYQVFDRVDHMVIKGHEDKPLVSTLYLGR